jgi:glutamate-1-semialdehyde 2,1-aminomutase
MAAGYAALTKLKNNARVIAVLNERAVRLTEGMRDAAAKYGIPMQIDTRGSMFGFFFNDKPVKNFADAASSDAEMFAAFHAGMLDRGFYFACSLYETGFISTAITDEMIEDTIKASDAVFNEIKNGK